MKPIWPVLGVIGVSAAIAVTQNRIYAAPASDADARPSALGAAAPELDDDTAPEQAVEVPRSGAAPAADSAGEPSGEVLESQDVASYTYLRLKTAAGEVWAAVPRTKVRLHEQVQITGASLMLDFESKTLKRTFPRIYFGNLAGAGASPGTSTGVGSGTPTGAGALPPGHPPIDSAQPDPYAEGSPLPPGHPPIDSL